MKLTSNTTLKSLWQSINKIRTKNNSATAAPLRKEIKDCVELSENGLERTMMNQVWEFGNTTGKETARVQKNGEKVPLIPLEKEHEVSFKNENFLSLYLKLKGTKYYHNHELELPLSPGDLEVMTEMEIFKMVNTTPSKGFSSLEIPIEKQKELEAATNVNQNNSEMLNDILEYSEKDIEKLKEMKLHSDNIDELMDKMKNASKEKIKEISDFRINQIQNFANKYGLIFKHELNH